jgi:glycogen phosphorylase
MDYVDRNDELRAVLELIDSGRFSDGDTEVFKPLADNLRYNDLNTARSGKFSSDRAIADYCDEIWNVQPVTVKVDR